MATVTDVNYHLTSTIIIIIVILCLFSVTPIGKISMLLFVFSQFLVVLLL